MTVTDEQIAKLPKWAQNEILRLRADIKSADAKLRKALGEEPSRVLVNPYGDVPLYLRDHETVRFYLTGEMRDGYIDVTLEPYRGTVRVSSGTALIKVIPGAGNVIRVASEEP